MSPPREVVPPRKASAVAGAAVAAAAVVGAAKAGASIAGDALAGNAMAGAPGEGAAAPIGEGAAGAEAAPRPRRPPLLAVGTMVWLASELMFFSGLFAAWFSLRAGAARWPPPGVELDLASVTVGTVLLVLSSGTMQLAVRAVERSDRLRFLRWLAASFVLGAVFLAGQARDWSRLHFGVGTHAYGSAFYLLTGFHGLHVAGGLAAMIIMAGRAASPRFGAEATPSVEMLSYYWHFVDVVWLAVYATIFLLR